MRILISLWRRKARLIIMKLNFFLVISLIVAVTLPQAWAAVAALLCDEKQQVRSCI